MKNVIFILTIVLLSLPVFATTIDVIGTQHPVCTSGKITSIMRPSAIVCETDTQSGSRLTMSYSSKVYGEIAFDYSKYIHFTLNGELNEGSNRFLVKSVERLLLLHGVGSKEAKRNSAKLNTFPLHGSELIKTNNTLINTGTVKQDASYVVQVYIK